MKKKNVLLLSILICLFAICFVLVSCNKNSSKASKINLGDDKKTVLATMGDPDEENGSTIYYYGKNYKSLQEEYEALDKKLENASSFADIDKIDAEYEKLEEKEASMEYEYTEIYFDNSDKVVKVIFDKKHKSEDEQDKELNNFTVISGGITKGKKTGKVTYKAEYTDGSYIIEQDYYISTKASDTENSNSVEIVIQNDFGEISVNVPTIIGEYIITYNLNGGNIDNSTGIYRESYKPGRAEIALQTPTRNGYTFKGWYDNEDLNGSAITTVPKESIGDKEFFAKWEIIVYTITYNLNGGKNNRSNPTSYTIEDNIYTLKEASKTDYVFEGWYLEPTFETLVSKIDTDSLENITLYAKFAATKIKDSEFFNNKDLKEYDIPDSVTSIGEEAFFGCTGLTSITIPDSVTSIGHSAFYGCTGLTSVTIGNGVTSIGGNAFYGCSGLTSITIPGSVTSIDWSTFSGCTGLTSVIVDGKNTVYDSRNDCNAIIETASNTLIAGYKNTVIPDSVTSIGDYAFDDCRGLTSITIPDSVTSIGDCAFNNCTGLTSITIPDSVTSIGFWAFRNCNGLTTAGPIGGDYSIQFGWVDAIPFEAFHNFTGLTSVIIPDSVTSIGSGAFSGCTGLTSVSIPDSVTSIGGNAFNDCTDLTSITIPDSVTSIGSYAFYNCRCLTSITYKGTKSQWKAISKGSNWSTNTGTNAIHCTDGDIAKS